MNTCTHAALSKYTHKNTDSHTVHKTQVHTHYPFHLLPCRKPFFSLLVLKSVHLTNTQINIHKQTAMPLNHGDLDMGHQLYNERLQTRDKYCLTCFHLLWCWYTDFPIKQNRVLWLRNLVDRSNEQSQHLKQGKILQFALSQVTFIDTFVWILRIWNLAVIRALYLSSKVPVRCNTSRDLLFMSDIHWNFHGLNKCQATERCIWAAAPKKNFYILSYSSNTVKYS